jgi:hypothetical protein
MGRVPHNPQPGHAVLNTTGPYLNDAASAAHDHTGGHHEHTSATQGTSNGPHAGRAGGRPGSTLLKAAGHAIAAPCRGCCRSDHVRARCRMREHDTIGARGSGGEPAATSRHAPAGDQP